MKKLDPRAWAILTEAEKNSLSLQFGLGKSSWEAGEMLKRSHYKYLEIKQRAEQFLKMFTEHFVYFRDVIPYGYDCTNVIREYLLLCIEKRYKPQMAVRKLKLTHPSITKAKINEELISTLKRWSKDPDLDMQQIVHIIKEFDRWNNFRILPLAIGEPSAFKRRLKNNHKKHIKILTAIPEISIKRIKKVFCPKKWETDFLYFPYLSPTPKLIKILKKPTHIEVFNKACLYLFKSEDEANEYITAIYGYTFGGKRDCKNGLIFWPKYREHIKNAHNYTDIQNITTHRKYLRLAMEKLEIL